LVANEISARLHLPVVRAPAGAAAMGAFLEAERLEPACCEETPAAQRVPTTPFIAAALVALIAVGGWAAHEVMNRPQVETTSVQLAPPGTAVLPHI
jgi:hypothetical protein